MKESHERMATSKHSLDLVAPSLAGLDVVVRHERPDSIPTEVYLKSGGKITTFVQVRYENKQRSRRPLARRLSRRVAAREVTVESKKVTPVTLLEHSHPPATVRRVFGVVDLKPELLTDQPRLTPTARARISAALVIIWMRSPGHMRLPLG